MSNNLSDIIRGVNQKDYILSLFLQFKQVMGINKKEDLSKHMEEFEEWIVEQKHYLRHYVSLMQEMGLHKNNGTIAEFSKGSFDTATEILTRKGFNTIVVTPHINSFRKIDEIYNGELAQTKDGIKIIDPIFKNIRELNLGELKTLITQLPNFNKKELEALLAAGQSSHEVFIGSYGDYYDSNAKKQKEQLDSIANSISSNNSINFRKEYILIGTTYVHVINFSPKNKVNEQDNDRSYFLK